MWDRTESEKRAHYNWRCFSRCPSTVETVVTTPSNFEAARAESEAVGGVSSVEKMWPSVGLELARKLRGLRTMRGLTQEELSEISGLSRNTISNLERNESTQLAASNPGLMLLFKLSHSLAIPPLALIPSLGIIPGSPMRLTTDQMGITSAVPTIPLEPPPRFNSPYEILPPPPIRPLPGTYYAPMPDTVISMPADTPQVAMMWPNPNNPDDTLSFSERALRRTINHHRLYSQGLTDIAPATTPPVEEEPAPTEGTPQAERAPWINFLQLTDPRAFGNSS